MRVVLNYQTEVVDINLSNTDVNFRYEISAINSSQKIVEFRNSYASIIGLKLEGLCPKTDLITSLNKIQVYDGEVLVKEFIGEFRAVGYRIFTPNHKSFGYDLEVQSLVEVFSVYLI